MRSTITFLATLLAAEGSAFAAQPAGDGETAVVFFNDASCAVNLGPVGQVSVHAEKGQPGSTGCSQTPSDGNHAAVFGKNCATYFYSDTACKVNVYNSNRVVADSACYSGVESYTVVCFSSS